MRCNFQRWPEAPASPEALRTTGLVNGLPNYLCYAKIHLGTVRRFGSPFTGQRFARKQGAPLRELAHGGALQLWRGCVRRRLGAGACARARQHARQDLLLEFGSRSEPPIFLIFGEKHARESRFAMQL